MKFKNRTQHAIRKFIQAYEVATKAQQEADILKMKADSIAGELWKPILESPDSDVFPEELVINFNGKAYLVKFDKTDWKHHSIKSFDDVLNLEKQS